MANGLRVKWDSSTAVTGEADGRETLYVTGFVTGAVDRSRCYVAGKTNGAHAFVFVPTPVLREGDVVSVNGEEIGKAHIVSAPGSEWGLAEGTLVQQASVQIPDGSPWLADLWNYVLPHVVEDTGDAT